MIILLNGNFIPLTIFADDKEKHEEILRQAIKNGKDDPSFYVKPTPDVFIFTKNIVGWYFRPKQTSPADKMLNFLDKKLPDLNEGEDWKS